MEDSGVARPDSFLRLCLLCDVDFVEARGLFEARPSNELDLNADCQTLEVEDCVATGQALCGVYQTSLYATVARLRSVSSSSARRKVRGQPIERLDQMSVCTDRDDEVRQSCPSARWF